MHLDDCTQAVRTVLAAFPICLCNGSSDERAIVSHLRSKEFLAAARCTHAGSAAIASASVAGDEVALEASLNLLHEGLLQRSLRHDQAAEIPAQIEILRLLFVCSVLLFEASLRNSPAIIVARHAAHVLQSLASIAHGAVALAQLAQLERHLLQDLAARSEMHSVLLGLCAAKPAASTVDGGAVMDAQRALAFRWVACALASPPLASALWADLGGILDLAADLRVPGRPAEEAFQSVVRAALQGLAVEVPEQRALAARVLDKVGGRCEEVMHGLLRTDGSARANREDTRQQQHEQLHTLCALHFGLMTGIKDPLLPQMLDTARELVRVATSGDEGVASSCCAPLREAVMSAPPGPRKRELVRWMMEL